jgi:hypothetical protein
LLHQEVSFNHSYLYILTDLFSEFLDLPGPRNSTRLAIFFSGKINLPPFMPFLCTTKCEPQLFLPRWFQLNKYQRQCER